MPLLSWRHGASSAKCRDHGWNILGDEFHVFDKRFVRRKWRVMLLDEPLRPHAKSGDDARQVSTLDDDDLVQEDERDERGRLCIKENVDELGLGWQ